jgi:hypothetical protein
MHEALQGATFHVEHVIPQSRGGRTVFENLAWACPGCNLHKADRVEVRDPESGRLISLFNPRTDLWRDHYEWSGYEISAFTATGRATIAALNLNHARRILIRRAEALFALFPAEVD